MIHAEISVYPMATPTASIGFYVAKAVEAAQELGIKCEAGPMGTLLEADSMAQINQAVSKMVEAVHNLGIGRIEAVIKVDSRRDRQATAQDKMDSLRDKMS